MLRSIVQAILILILFAASAPAGENDTLFPALGLLLGPQAHQSLRYPPETAFTEIATDTSVPLPGYQEAIEGPVFHNRIIRLSRYPDIQVNFPYPKTPSWNSDGSLLMLPYRLLDGRTYQVIAENTWWDDDERKWSALHPHIYYAMEHNRDLDGDGVRDHALVRRDVSPTLATGAVPDKEILIRFSGAEYEKMLLGNYEGNIDHQDRFVVLAACKNGKHYLTAIVYDIAGQKIHSQKDLTAIRWEDDNGGQVFDWISISPSGRHILINWLKYPGDMNGDTDAVIDQYDRELNFIRELAHQGQHGDIGVQENGNDMYVQFEFGGVRRGIWGYDLETGRETRLLPDKYNGGHVSCRNYRRPGWCYLSTTAMGYREVFALKLDGSGTVNRFAQTHQSSGNSHGGVNADGTKIIFQSDWHAATAVDAQGQHVREAFVAEVVQ